ncbi:MAG TPA: MFS transporter [Chloroflexota bacterium]|nr:MFS transporter [Chloroflexota bacterium]
MATAAANRRAAAPDALLASEEVAGRGPVSVLEFAPPRAPSALHGFRALRHHDFRLFYSGQLVSLIGTWMQDLAQSWLALVLTNSALALGLVGAVQFLPVLLFSTFGGTIADRAPKRWVLVGTQSAQMVLAFVLAALTFTHVVTYVDVLILALLLGTASSVDMPTRQAFVVELVGPKDLMNAIALNSSMFNAARLIGPSIAGLLIGIIGIDGCFFLNGLSFSAVIVSLLLMHPPAPAARGRAAFQGIWEDLREGLRYVRQAPSVLAVIVLVGLLGTFGYNFNVVLPILARNVLVVGATGLGWLTGAMGLGSLVASLGVAYFGGQPRPRVIVGAAAAFSVLEIALAPVSSYAVALALLVVIGASMVVVSAIANTYVQSSVPHRLRGRVMSIYSTVFVGTTPIGNTLAGAIAATSGTFGPLLLGGLMSLVGAVVVGRWLWNAPVKLGVQRHERARP